MWYLQVCHGTVRTWQLRTRSCSKVESHQVLCCSIWYALVHTDTKWITLTHAHLLNKWHRLLSRAALKNFRIFFVCLFIFSVCLFACLFPKLRLPFKNSKKFFFSTIDGRYRLPGTLYEQFFSHDKTVVRNRKFEGFPAPWRLRNSVF